MSICVSGISQPQPGSPASIAVDAGFMASLLPSPLNVWLTPFLSQMPPIQIVDTATFCSIDPPTLPILTSTVVGELLFPALGEFIGASTIVSAVVQYYLWFTLCQCSAGAQPTAAAGQVAPSGLPAVNPTGIVSPNASVPCFTMTVGPVLPGSFTETYPTSGSLAVPLPGTATYIVMTVTRTPAGSGHGTLYNQANFYNAPVQSGNLQTSLTNSQAVGDPNPKILSAPIGVIPHYGTLGIGSNSGNTDLITAQWDFYCGGQVPGGTQSSCCAPDPTATGLLNQILQYVTLIQRELAPQHYIPDAAHSGLTGLGAITVPGGLLGVLVSVTATSSYSGLKVSEPNYLFDVGWLSFSTADGVIHREQITATHQVIQPKGMAEVTAIGYSLAQGVAITLTELDPEP